MDRRESLRYESHLATLRSGGAIAENYGNLMAHFDCGYCVLAVACCLAACGDKPELAVPAAPEWARTFPGPGEARAEKVAFDSQGNVLVVGTFTETIDVDGAVLTSAGSSDIFLVKLDVNGRRIWARQFGSEGEDRGRSLAVDAHDNLFLTGFFSREVDFGAGPLTSTAENSVFLVKLDTTGAVVFNHAFGDRQFYSGADVAVARDGSIYLTGDFVSPIDLGGGALVSAGSSDIFLAKFDPSGVHLMSRAFGDAAMQESRGLAVNAAGEVVLMGSYQGLVDFGGGALVGGEGTENAIFVAKYDDRMNHIWSDNAVSADAHAGHEHGASDGAHSVATDQSDHTLLTGATSTGLALTGADFEAPSAPIAFLQEFGRYGDRVVNRALGVGDTQDEGAVAIDGSGRILVTGAFRQSLDLGRGAVLDSRGGRDLFVAVLDPSGNDASAFRYGDADHSEIGWSVADPEPSGDSRADALDVTGREARAAPHERDRRANGSVITDPGTKGGEFAIGNGSA